MHKALSRTLWGVVFVGGLTVLGAGSANAADTSGEDGMASGNQIGILGEVPVTIGGNAISILGDSSSAGTVSPPATAAESTGTAATTSGQDAILGGNQVMPDATLPITIGGNSISIIGDSETEPATAAPTEESSDDAPATTSGADGVASGNQVAPDADAPVIVSGNDVAVIRDDGFRDRGLLDSILEDGLLSGVLHNGASEGLPILADTRRAPMMGDMAMTEPVVDGPLFGDVEFGDVEFVSPISMGTTVAEATAVEEDTSPGSSPLMATAALAPAMMLAATGGESLPLVGGIALMLATGLALVASGRMTHAVS